MEGVHQKLAILTKALRARLVWEIGGSEVPVHQVVKEGLDIVRTQVLVV